MNETLSAEDQSPKALSGLNKPASELFCSYACLLIYLIYLINIHQTCNGEISRASVCAGKTVLTEFVPV